MSDTNETKQMSISKLIDEYDQNVKPHIEKLALVGQLFSQDVDFVETGFGRIDAITFSNALWYIMRDAAESVQDFRAKMDEQ